MPTGYNITVLVCVLIILLSVSRVLAPGDDPIYWAQYNNAPWTSRTSFSGLVLPGGTVVVMGGEIDRDGSQINDVWRSLDNGASWSKVTTNAGWAGTFYALTEFALLYHSFSQFLLLETHIHMSPPPYLQYSLLFF